MGNHSFDCKHCGQDQRTAGLRCCTEAMAEMEAASARFNAAQEERRALFVRHGLEVFFFGDRQEVAPRIESVVAYLRKVEEGRSWGGSQ